MLLKCYTQYASKYGKLGSGCRTGKGQFSFQSQTKAMPKNVQTTTLLHSFIHQQSNAQNSLSWTSTVHEPRTSRCSSWIQKRQRNQRSNCTICWVIEREREFQKNIYICFIDCTKAFVYMDHKNLWKIIKEMGIPDLLTCLLRNLFAGQ